MSVEENKANYRRITEEIWIQGNLALVDELFAPNYVNHDPTNPEVRDLKGFKEYIVATRTALQEMKVTIDDLIAEGDKVAGRWTARATHKAEWGGIPATGKQVTMTGMTISRFVDGKTVENWWSTDSLGLLQQLGIVPPME
jgi:steroid delta-isomerase-like uncharacterized protein